MTKAAYEGKCSIGSFPTVSFKGLVHERHVRRHGRQTWFRMAVAESVHYDPQVGGCNTDRLGLG